MLFSSISFLYYFLPIVIFWFFLLPKQVKNYCLLLASLVFYGWGESKYVFLMIGIILVGYLLGLAIEANLGTKMGKVYLGVAVAVDVLTLGYFKYADFFIENFNKVTGFSTPLLKIALPIGISFYIFQILSYNIDVYRGNVKAQKNPFLLATYVAMFPQLIAGPIVRYVDIESQLRDRKISVEIVSSGIQRFMIGLSKKVLIANALGVSPEECLFVGDTSVDMLTANSAGMKAVGVLWGFRPEAELKDTGAHYIISHTHEILNLI